ncbi:glycosyltransferase family 4 protein [Pseudodesulfovibrio sp. zrk46]|uniref:glycosyltransferase family 4 protein n=1 Tax=Pseudodesulfovibrio sp. zrk46 TaxID=2725288 RepID=UPI001448F176|nr:glycosyltransferase family 4 protein [Pseudodesulfovibrio sp. zrk46]QJB55939.1 glycosyltransferase family 4 protein [Pseudodesulfovibrio sp. zrk46]
MSVSKRIWGTLDPFYEPGPILGRKVANIKFLGALLSDDSFDEYHFFLADRKLGKSLMGHLEKVAPTLVAADRVKVFDRRELPAKLAEVEYHCFHLSDCITSQPSVAALRNRYSRRIFPITGTIHSLSYSDFGVPFLRHLWPGTTARDAIVCTSTLGKQAVGNFFGWLRESYGLDEAGYPAPELARIPLAVDINELRPGGARAEGGPVRLLVFGRISHHSKMDLLPLIRALHRLFSDGVDRESVELVLAGWADDDDDFLPTLRDYVQNVGIQTSIKLRPTEAEKCELFQSADIFVSIADNPQETFGITMVEAGAFGLPSVASEYDGYRDIIVHGETGLLVPTVGPEETPDADLLAPVTYDNQYHLLLSQRTAVEVPALADALRTLIESPEMRRTMGEAARKCVEEQFTWQRVIQEHCTLWDTLWQAEADAEPLREIAHPLAIPYGKVFGHFTSRTLEEGVTLKAGRTGEAFYRDKDYPTLYSGMTHTIDPNVAKKLVFLARKPIDSATLIRKLTEVAPQIDEQSAKNHVLWSLKHDILERV